MLQCEIPLAVSLKTARIARGMGVRVVWDSAPAFAQRGVRAVVVKLGEAGAFYLSDDASSYLPPFKVQAVDTVAAGDAFGAATACALAESRSLKEVVRHTAAAGALAVTRPGAKQAMPTCPEMKLLLSSLPTSERAKVGAGVVYHAERSRRHQRECGEYVGA